MTRAEQTERLGYDPVTADDKAVRVLVAQMDDGALGVYVRAGEGYVRHVPPGVARDRVSRRLQIAREERRRRAALAREATPTHR